MNKLNANEQDLKILKSNENEYLGKNKPVNKIKPLVSVRVQTYQHVDYIADCLDGILMQKTDFPFEVIVGEDDSTDGTRQICKEYAEKHPDLIRLFLRSRNDVIYFGGHPTGKFNSRANRAASRGKYTAICEGDDYWTDPHKLQKQLDYFQENPGCKVCTHAAKVINVNGGVVGEIRPSTSDTSFNVEDMIRGGGGFVATPSLMYLSSLTADAPPLSPNSRGGDYYLQILGAYYGYVGYIDEFMAVYRTGVKGSWMTRSAEDIELNIITNIGNINMLDEFDLYSGKKYSSAIILRKQYHIERLLLINHNNRKHINSELKEIIKSFPLQAKTKYQLLLYFPFLMNLNKLSFIKKMLR